MIPNEKASSFYHHLTVVLICRTILCTFKSNLEKIEKESIPKKFPIIQEMELSSSKIKIFLISRNGTF